MQQCQNESGTLDPKQILHHFDNSRPIQPHTNEKITRKYYGIGRTF